MAELDLASLVVSVRADVRDASTGIDQLNKKIDGISGTVKQAGQDTASVQQEMKEGWVGLSAQLQVFNELQASIGKPLLNFFKNAVSGASDLQETISKTNVVFKEYADDVMEWSENSTKTMGLSQQSALSMASSFGDLATSMGLATNTSQQMAMSLTQLAADLASFKNIDAQQAFTALQGIFTGNAQALKGLGVVMNETTLEAFALSQGITTSYQSMSEAEKVALRYQFVLEQTSNAQGDFARTSSGFANASRTLSESFSELGDSLGSLLLPALETGMAGLQGIIDIFNDMPDSIKSVITALGVMATSYTVLTPLISKFVGILSTVIPTLKAVEASTILTVGKISAIVLGITALISGLAKMYSESKAKSEASAREIAAVEEELQHVDDIDPTIEISIQRDAVTTKINNLANKLDKIDTKKYTADISLNSKAIDDWLNRSTKEQLLTIPAKIADATTESDFVEIQGILNSHIMGLRAKLSMDNLTPEERKAIEDAINGLVDVKLFIKPAYTSTQTNKEELKSAVLKVQKDLHSLGDEGKAHIGALIQYDPNGFKTPDDYLDEMDARTAHILTEIDSATTKEQWNTLKGEITDFTRKVTFLYPTGQEITDDANAALASASALDALPITTTVEEPQQWNLDLVKYNTQQKINEWHLKTKLSIALPDGKEKGEAFKGSVEDAIKSINGFIFLQKSNGADTAAGEALLERAEKLRDEGANIDISGKVPKALVEDMSKLSNDYFLLVSASETFWNRASSKSIKEIADTMYKEKTGNDASGSLYTDIQNLYNYLTNTQLGENSLIAQINDAIQGGIDLTGTWQESIQGIIDEMAKIPASYAETQSALYLEMSKDAILRARNAKTDEERDQLMAEGEEYFNMAHGVFDEGKKAVDIIKQAGTDFQAYAKATLAEAEYAEKHNIETETPSYSISDYTTYMAEGMKLFDTALSDFANQAEEGRKATQDFFSTIEVSEEERAKREEKRQKALARYEELSSYGKMKQFGYEGDYEADLQQAYNEAFANSDLFDALNKYASYKGYGDIDTLEKVLDNKKVLQDKYDNAETEEERAYYKTGLDFFQTMQNAFSLKGFAEIWTAAIDKSFTGFSEEQLAGLDELGLKFAKEVQGLYEKGVDLLSPEAQGALMSYIQPWLDKIQTGTEGTAAGGGGNVVNGTNNDIKGDMVMGSKQVGDIITQHITVSNVADVQPSIMQVYDGAVAESGRVASSITGAIYGGVGTGG